MTNLWRIFLLLGLCYLLICAAMFVLQRKLIYHPTPAHPGAQNLSLENDGLQLQVAQAQAAGQGKALLYFGGNAEDVAYSVRELAQLFPQHAIYALHYRGYGGSAGEPNEVGNHADAWALWQLLRSRYAEITIMGRSLGTGIATRLAARADSALQHLILVTPYDSMQAVAAHHYPWLPVQWLLRERYASLQYAPQVKAPCIIFAAAQDQVVPPVHAQRLAQGFTPGRAQMLMVEGADHHNISETAVYRQALLKLGR
ncbi:alpha/beta fold hydrolase [Massilia sp. W12]|uniref:alpha/beta hydrolase n=1 Tax=Massilia sp. W12 TaxID=3126507 RepID=UPI0030CBDB93